MRPDTPPPPPPPTTPPLLDPTGPYYLELPTRKFWIGPHGSFLVGLGGICFLHGANGTPIC